MKNLTCFTLTVTLIGLALASAGCNPTGNAVSPPAAEAPILRSSQKAPPGFPQDYFPVATGTSWRYEITLGPAEPLDYNESLWPYGNGHRTTCTRRLLVTHDFEQVKSRVHYLELRITGEGVQPAAPMYPNGYEVDLVQDDLKLFGRAKRIYFATKIRGGFEAVLLATYAPESDSLNSGGAWGSWSAPNGPDGYGFRLFCFAEKPGTEIGFGKNPRDRLLFLGVEDKHPKLKGGPFLHFKRSVDESKRDEDREPSYLDKAFTEDLWFGRGQGLVQLEQKVEGLPSMVWCLVESGREPAGTGTSKVPTAGLRL